MAHESLFLLQAIVIGLLLLPLRYFVQRMLDRRFGAQIASGGRSLS
jgi:hypothetical protein